MLTLLLNTAAAEGWVALARVAADSSEAELLAEEPLPGRASSEAILPAIRAVFARTEHIPRELGAVVVLAGPGSFTGVRVGMAAAKGVCDATGARLLTVSRLALMAYAADPKAAELLVLLDAGRGEYYGGVRGPGFGTTADEMPLREQLMTRQEVETAMQERLVVTTETGVRESLGAAVRLLPEPVAGTLLGFALPRLRRAEWTDLASADAHYLRRTDAELKVEARSAKAAECEPSA